MIYSEPQTLVSLTRLVKERWHAKPHPSHAFSLLNCMNVPHVIFFPVPLHLRNLCDLGKTITTLGRRWRVISNVLWETHFFSKTV